MLLHLVCFKYKPETEEAKRVQHRERLAALADLDGVVDLKVGADVVRAPRSFDTGLAVTFTDRAALDAYQAHPRHVAVVQAAHGLCQQIVAVDFEL
jgi:hypothetical protein